ncbi:MAG: 2-isopropylmalate synthase, partial [Bradymonadia bacterium]
RIYSGVPAGLFGKRQSIEVGHMSGLSNVLWWLGQNEVEPVDGLAEYVLSAAKQRSRVLDDAEVRGLVNDFHAAR